MASKRRDYARRRLNDYNMLYLVLNGTDTMMRPHYAVHTFVISSVRPSEKHMDERNG